MKVYLVTGGAGFIGSNFIYFLLKKYDDIKIINVDNIRRKFRKFKRN